MYIDSQIESKYTFSGYTLLFEIISGNYSFSYYITDSIKRGFFEWNEQIYIFLTVI